jgi:hypothetical protein
VSDRRARLVAGAPEDVEEILRVLDAATIRVVLPERVPWRRQVLAITLVDMLGRLFPRIEIVGADEQLAHPLLPPGAGLLRERLEAVRAHGTEPLGAGGVAAVTVVVGQSTEQVDGDVIYCDGNGWQAYLGPEPSALAGDGDEQIPIGPLTAACRAAARAFASALGGRGPALRELVPTYWSALTFEPAPSPLPSVELSPLGPLEAVLAGAGSIGGATAYAFANVPGLRGELAVVDSQAYAPDNPDRALLATNAVVASGIDKAEHVKQVLGHLPKLNVAASRCSIEQWVALRDLGPLALVLCAFDSVESRRELQDCLPLEVINAACGGDHVAVSGHVTNNGPCVYCLHVADVLDTERITFKLIVRSTGLAPRLVQAWLENRVPVEEVSLREIERNRGMAAGALAPYAGRTIDEIHRLALAYGEFAIELGDGGAAAVAAPWVTALAGFLLAGEALKTTGADAYRPYQLGPWAAGRTRYEEMLYGSTADAIVHAVPRWEGSECLCRSARRLRLLAELYADA